MIRISELKAIKWQYLVNRKEALLSQSFNVLSYLRFREVTGIPWTTRYVLRIGTEYYNSAEDLDRLRSIFYQGRAPLLGRLLRILIDRVEALDRLASKIVTLDVTVLTRGELVSWFRRYTKAALRAYLSLLPMPIADGALSRLIRERLPPAKESMQQRWLATLAYPVRENVHVDEARSFFRLAAVYKKGCDVKSRIDRHLSRFAWMGSRGYWFEHTWTEADLRRRLEDFFAQRKDPRRELAHLERVRKDQQRQTRQLLRRFRITRRSELFRLIQLAKEYAYRRTWRTDQLYLAGFKARHLFHEIGRRAGLKPHDVAYMTFQELVETARRGKRAVSRAVLRQRKTFVAQVLFLGRYTVLAGRQWEQRLKRIIRSKQQIRAAPTLRGTTAYPGRTDGRVKIVLTSNDIAKVERGDILVAVMTLPQFVPAMERAAAFVTDEGGILSHAAIVSREMRKPCVIATRAATKVLKDGDRVEVDATRGIVRKV